MCALPAPACPARRRLGLVRLFAASASGGDSLWSKVWHIETLLVRVARAPSFSMERWSPRASAPCPCRRPRGACSPCRILCHGRPIESSRGAFPFVSRAWRALPGSVRPLMVCRRLCPKRAGLILSTPRGAVHKGVNIPRRITPPVGSCSRGTGTGAIRSPRAISTGELMQNQRLSTAGARMGVRTSGEPAKPQAGACSFDLDCHNSIRWIPLIRGNPPADHGCGVKASRSISQLVAMPTTVAIRSGRSVSRCSPVR